jgi:hypothetical protein
VNYITDAVQGEAAAGHWTAAEIVEQEQTGEIQVSALLGIVAEYQEALDAKCPDHKQVLIRAMRTAIEHRTPMPEIVACVDAKLIDILGCAACSAVKR